jgi:hypothetical protein
MTDVSEALAHISWWVAALIGMALVGFGVVWIAWGRTPAPCLLSFEDPDGRHTLVATVGKTSTGPSPTGVGRRGNRSS